MAGEYNTKLSDPEKDQKGGRNCGGASDRETRGYIGALPHALKLMVTRQEDEEHDLGIEGGEVLDGLHPGDRSLSLLEYVRPGPHA